MFKRETLCKLTGWILVLAIVVSFVAPIVNDAIAAKSMSQQEKLGSPLLNQNFTSEEWNPKELAVFGIFLSNFAVPLLDNYSSTFSITSDSGSKGRGMKALMFGSDPATESMLKEMIAYCCEIQSSNNLTPIYVRKIVFNAAGTVEEKGWEEAKLYHMINLDGNEGGKTDLGDRTSREYYHPNSFAQFGVKKSADTTTDYQTVFDATDGYDISSWAALVNMAWHDKQHKSAFEKAYNNYDDTGDKETESKNAKLYLDAFGNIVFRNGDRNIIVFPACANQYITKNEAYNFITRIFLGGKYIGLSRNQIALSIEGCGGSSSNITYETEKLSDGTMMLYHASTAPFKSALELQLAANMAVNAGIVYGGGVTQDEINKINVDNYKKYFGFTADIAQYKLDKGYGNHLIEMLQCDITQGKTKKQIPLMLAIQGSDEIDSHDGDLFDEGSLDVLGEYINENCCFIDSTKDMLIDIDFLGKKKYCIFDRPVAVPVQEWRSKDKTDQCYTSRLFIKHVGDIMTNTSMKDHGIRSFSFAKDENTEKALRRISKDGNNVSTVFSDFMNTYYKEYLGSSGYYDLTGLEFGDGDHWYNSWVLNDTPFEGISVSPYTEATIACIYPKNTTLSAVSNYLGFNADQDGEISQMCKNMYYTYLKWYGVISSEYDNELNEYIFKSNSDLFKKDFNDFTESTGGLTEEDKKKEVLNRTYLMLDPEKGRSLRKSLYQNSFNDIVFDWYSKMVYGNSSYTSTSETEGGVSAGQASEGFLGVDNYYENPFTSWFVNMYDDIAIILLGVGLIIILMIWLLMRKKFMWVASSIALLINVILLTPSVGDVVPYITDKVILNTFNEQLGYWALCENVANMKIEQSNIKDAWGNDVSDEVAALVQELNMNYSDRALMLKYDISRKVTSSAISNYDELQNLKTSFWILPQILRQFSSADNSALYVYVPMSDALKASRTLYGAYDPRTEFDIETGEFTPVGGDDAEIRIKAWDDLTADFDYDLIRTDSATVESTGVGIRPICADTDTGYHRRFYYLTSGSSTLKVPNLTIGTRDADRKVIMPTISDATKTNFRDMSNIIERSGGLYNTLDNSSVAQEYGYLWMTESPLPYMYFVMKDTYTKYTENYGKLSHLTTTVAGGKTMSAIVKDSYADLNITENSHINKMVDMIQGTYMKTSTTTGNGNRANFMYDGVTGKTKDFLDLRHFMTNTAQYMYKTHLFAGGNEGTDGIFGEEKIGLYSLYKNNYKSWMFRCNWAEKIYTNKEFNEPYKIRLSDGTQKEVTMQIMPQSYVAAGRQMVFSEAEMKALGLREKDLSIVELKCLEVNRQTARDITMLLNYVNMSGLTTEAMLQQMALIATNNFCKIMSPDNGFNNQMALYPQSVDLRNISFDSVARVMVLGATNDAYYTHGNVMYNMIANSDIIASILLLLCCLFCVTIIPMIRNVLMALLLFLGLWSTLTNFVAGDKQRWKITGSYIINLLIFLATNVLFYIILSMLMSISSPTDILKDGHIGLSVRSPIVVLLILLALSIAFIVCAWKQIIFTVKNYKDMGATMFSVIFAGIADKITGGLSAIGDKLSGGSGGVESGSGGNTGGGSGIGSGSGGTTIDGDIETSDSSGNDGIETGEELDGSNETSGYTDPTAIESDRDEEQDAADIDDKIARGKDDSQD